jgi:hypothetical protein
LLRSTGAYSEDELAQKAGFGSAEGMYRQLESWGLSGLLPSGENSQAVVSGTAKSSGERKPRKGGGEVVELPPAANAAPLFARVIEKLNEAVRTLSTRIEYFQGGRFVATNVRYDLGMPGYRGKFQQGPRRQNLFSIDLYLNKTPLGASWEPPEPLTTLIGVYAITGEPLKPLVEALHLEPTSEVWESLEKRIEKDDELRPAVNRVARVVRGGTVGRGRKYEEISHDDQIAGWWANWWAREGHSDEEIQTMLSRQGHEYTISDINRLKNLDLSSPQQLPQRPQ